AHHVLHARDRADARACGLRRRRGARRVPRRAADARRRVRRVHRTRMTPRSIVIATDIDVLPRDRIVVRRNGYTLVRSPSNPAHHWGNLLLFDEPPDSGDAERWEELFEREFRDEPRVRHR